MPKTVNINIEKVKYSNIGEGGKVVVGSEAQRLTEMTPASRFSRLRVLVISTCIGAAIVATVFASLPSGKPNQASRQEVPLNLQALSRARLAAKEAVFMAREKINSRGAAALVMAPDRNGDLIPIYAASHALLIGVGDYADAYWPDLAGVMRDIDELEVALRDHHGFNVTKLLDPSKVELMKGLNRFAATAGKDKNNRILIYYAGHGHTSGTGSLSTGWLVPRDAPDPNTHWEGFVDRAVGMKSIEHLSTVIASKHVLWVFDSCFSGQIIGNLRSGATSKWENYLKQNFVRRIITSGSVNQKVPDKSIFARYFVAALTGKKWVSSGPFFSGREFSTYLQKSVVNETGDSQTPQFGTIKLFDVDEGDIVFRSPRRPSP